MSVAAQEKIKEAFGDAVIEVGSQHGGEWVVVAADRLLDVATYLKNTLGMLFLMDITGVDLLHFDVKSPKQLDDPNRFEIVYQFYAHTSKERLRVKVRRGVNALQIPSIVSLYKSANWLERLVYDFHGIHFEGHPNQRRLLTYDSFQGHPLRKDYPVHLRQPLIGERDVKDLIRGPGPGTSDRNTPFSQRESSRPNTKSDAYD